MKNTFDFMLLPPLSIKNSLPCSFEIMKSQTEGQGFVDFANEGTDVKSSGLIFSFDKEDEKHLHMFDLQGSHQDEIYIRYRVSGFVWGIAHIKRKANLGEIEDKDLKVKDIDGNVVAIGVRIQSSKAGI